MEFRVEGFGKIVEVVTGVSVESLTDEQMTSIDQLIDSVFPNQEEHPRRRQAEYLRQYFGCYAEPMDERQLRKNFMSGAKLHLIIPALQEKAIKEFVCIIMPALPKKAPVQIKELDLPVRLQNILQWKKYETSEHLSQCSAKELLSLDNFGMQSLILINQKLCLLGHDPIR